MHLRVACLRVSIIQVKGYNPVEDPGNNVLHEIVLEAKNPPVRISKYANHAPPQKKIGYHYIMYLKRLVTWKVWNNRDKFNYFKCKKSPNNTKYNYISSVFD